MPIVSNTCNPPNPRSLWRIPKRFPDQVQAQREKASSRHQILQSAEYLLFLRQRVQGQVQSLIQQPNNRALTQARTFAEWHCNNRGT